MCLATSVVSAKRLLIPGSRIHPASIVVIPVGAVGRCRRDGNPLEMMRKLWKKYEKARIS